VRRRDLLGRGRVFHRDADRDLVQVREDAVVCARERSQTPPAVREGARRRTETAREERAREERRNERAHLSSRRSSARRSGACARARRRRRRTSRASGGGPPARPASSSTWTRPRTARRSPLSRVGPRSRSRCAARARAGDEPRDRSSETRPWSPPAAIRRRRSCRGGRARRGVSSFASESSLRCGRTAARVLSVRHRRGHSNRVSLAGAGATRHAQTTRDAPGGGVRAFTEASSRFGAR